MAADGVPGAALPGTEVHLAPARVEGEGRAQPLGQEARQRQAAAERARHDAVGGTEPGGEAGGHGLGAGGGGEVGAAVADAGGDLGAAVADEDQSHANTPRQSAVSLSCWVAPRQSPV